MLSTAETYRNFCILDIALVRWLIVWMGEGCIIGVMFIGDGLIVKGCIDKNKSHTLQILIQIKMDNKTVRIGSMDSFNWPKQ